MGDGGYDVPSYDQMVSSTASGLCDRTIVRRTGTFTLTGMTVVSAPFSGLCTTIRLTKHCQKVVARLLTLLTGLQVSETRAQYRCPVRRFASRTVATPQFGVPAQEAVVPGNVGATLTR